MFILAEVLACLDNPERLLREKKLLSLKMKNISWPLLFVFFGNPRLTQLVLIYCYFLKIISSESGGKTIVVPSIAYSQFGNTSVTPLKKIFAMIVLIGI